MARNFNPTTKQRKESKGQFMVKYLNLLNFFLFFQMGILLATANFDIFLDKTESAQRSTDAEDSENPLYRFVSRKNQFFVVELSLCTAPKPRSVERWSRQLIFNYSVAVGSLISM